MIVYKVLPLFIILAASYCTKEFQSIYVKAVQCNFSEGVFYKNHSCFAKSYNRSFSTINVYALAIRPMENFLVSYPIYLGKEEKKLNIYSFELISWI